MSPMDQHGQGKDGGDAGKAVAFLAVKAAIFILLPLIAAVVAALVMLK
ncbi:MAG: hypothetical protein JNM89_08180 [Hyphomicrobiaceae bacterium]|nr:hypothetical protein [Hyphomicrobiaceae bacterium]